MRETCASSTSVRACRNGRVKVPKTEASIRAVPVQTIALAALERLPANGRSPLVFPSPNGGYFDLHNFRNRCRYLHL
jgi:hypothetical protein